MENNWTDFRRKYSDMFKIPEDVVDLMAIEDILLFCVSGRSNSTISIFLSMDIPYIEKAISSVFVFNGFEKDLDFNCFSVYNTCNKDYETYAKMVAEKYIIPTELIAFTFGMCHKFDEIERRINSYYEQS